MFESPGLDVLRATELLRLLLRWRAFPSGGEPKVPVKTKSVRCGTTPAVGGAPYDHKAMLLGSADPRSRTANQAYSSAQALNGWCAYVEEET